MKTCPLCQMEWNPPPSECPHCWTPLANEDTSTETPLSAEDTVCSPPDAETVPGSQDIHITISIPAAKSIIPRLQNFAILLLERIDRYQGVILPIVIILAIIWGSSIYNNLPSVQGLRCIESVEKYAQNNMCRNGYYWYHLSDIKYVGEVVDGNGDKLRKYKAVIVLDDVGYKDPKHEPEISYLHFQCNKEYNVNILLDCNTMGEVMLNADKNTPE